MFAGEADLESPQSAHVGEIPDSADIGAFNQGLVGRGSGVLSRTRQNRSLEIAYRSTQHTRTHASFPTCVRDALREERLTYLTPPSHKPSPPLFF